MTTYIAVESWRWCRQQETEPGRQQACSISWLCS